MVPDPLAFCGEGGKVSICLVAARETVIQSTHTKCRAFRSNGPNLGTFCCQGLLRPHVDQALRWIIRKAEGREWPHKGAQTEEGIQRELLPAPDYVPDTCSALVRQGRPFPTYKGGNNPSEEKLPQVAQQELVESELTLLQNSTAQSVSPRCVPVT